MTTHTATVSERGQVTLPASVRRALGVGVRGRVVFEVDDNDEVRVLPAHFTLESAFASVPPLEEQDLMAQSRQAKDEKAQRTLEDLSS